MFCTNMVRKFIFMLSYTTSLVSVSEEWLRLVRLVRFGLLKELSLVQIDGTSQEVRSRYARLCRDGLTLRNRRCCSIASVLLLALVLVLRSHDLSCNIADEIF